MTEGVAMIRKGDDGEKEVGDGDRMKKALSESQG
jgi:hypothetical protein